MLRVVVVTKQSFIRHINNPNRYSPWFSPFAPPRCQFLSSSTTTTTTAINGTSTNNNHKVVQVQKSPRRRHRRIDMSGEEVPSYKEFVHRFTVLSLYRNYLKTIQKFLSPHNQQQQQQELKEQVQREFRAHKDIEINDSFNLQRALADGQRRFRELQELTGSGSPDADSWLNTQDVEDPRGRVGEGWPWDQSS
jgi:hypothetical protein